MHLKKLDIYGFKSFADRVEFLFNQGITGVVGPNGSGKSNIADAVRWVLGEQSAKTLRGAKMEDIIFGGTEARKPLAYCEVSLTFGNESGLLPVDYNEVVITRRVYRSGESEYFLNKTACRLRDITDLFRDTGVGKEGYSLIGQGRIDEILSQRSEDRRQIFEEAAGISKYKARKTESERRLINTRQNLDRVQDIITELEGQLVPLEAQAQVARRYRKLSEELKTLELNDFVIRHDRSTQRLADMEEQQNALLQEEQQAISQEKELRDSINQAQDAIGQMEDQLTQEQNTVLAVTRDSEARDGALGILAEQQKQDEREISRLGLEDTAALEKRETLEQEHIAPAEDNEEIRNLLEIITALEKDVQNTSTQLHNAETQLEGHKSAIIEGMNRLSGVKSAHARMSAMREGLISRRETLEAARSQGDELLAQTQSRMDEAQQTLTKAQSLLSAIKEDHAKAQAAGESLAKEKDQAQALLTRTREAMREAQSRLKMLEQMERDYEGYQHSVREVMKNAGERQGILGVVAEVMKVPKDYERAIEMTLGGQLQHIVCKTQEDAKRQIDHLRASRAGRATFLPLDAVRGRTLNPQERQCLHMPGCLGVASELVEFDEAFRPVVENLLGRTVIAENLDAGIQIMRQARHAFRLVTLEGDVMHSGGSMTGGSTQARITSLLSREREIAEHRSAVMRLTSREKESLAQMEQIESSLTAAREQFLSLSTQMHEQEIAIERAQSHKEHALSLLTQAREATESSAAEYQQLCESLADIDRELQSVEETAGGEESQTEESRKQAAILQEQVLALRSHLDEAREELSGHRVDLAAAQQEHEAAMRDEKRRENELEFIQRSMSRREQERQALLEALAQRELQIKEGTAELLALREKLDTHQQNHRTLEIRRTTLQQALRNHLESQEGTNATLTDIVERKHRLEMQKNRTQSELENLIARIWETYELTYGGALAYRQENEPEGGTGRMEEIRKEIRSMGAVNVSAIEDFTAMQERFTGLTTQRDDLMQAEADILRIIDELTARMEKQFSQQFALLNQNFNRTFSKLFGGGRAELRLTDQSDVLNCGIDIVAQPPGKKLQLLSLLSGGERALTAISILFAMLDLKPTPFCILDEIEAALDESNVYNFASFLSEYSHSTQFIVVTHRKGTMECCDSLYGIAMQERGVSSMVSVEMAALEAV